MRTITGLKMNYKEWNEYLKPLMKDGFLDDLFFTYNEFIGKVPKGKYWYYEDNEKAELVGLPCKVKGVKIDDNVFVGQEL